MAEAVAVRREHGDTFGLGRALNMLGGVLGDNAKDEPWASVVNEGAALQESIGDITGLAYVRSRLGWTALGRGDADGARALLTEALALFAKDGFEFGMADTLLGLGGVDADRGEIAAAAGCYAESLRLYQAVGSQEGVIDALVATAELAVRCGHADAATRLLAAGAARAETLGYTETSPKRAQTVNAARGSLGPDGFAEAWAIGSVLALEQAVAEASALLTAVTRPPEGDAPRVALPNGLTPREREVLALVAEGLSDREVAARLFVGPGTVRSHLTSSYGKLAVGSRTAAVAAARRLGIV